MAEVYRAENSWLVRNVAIKMLLSDAAEDQATSLTTIYLMKRCPECRRDYYDDTLLYCLDDGNALLEGPAKTEPPASAGGFLSSDEPATAILPSTAAPGDAPTRAQIRTTDEEVSNRNITDTDSRNSWNKLIKTTAIALCVLTAFAAIGFGIYKLFYSKPPQTIRSSEDIKTVRLTGDGRTRQPVISPDGKFLVFVKLENGQESLWIKQIQTNSSVNVVKPGEFRGIWGITFSPDGNFVYFNADLSSLETPTVYRVPTLGGIPERFLSNAWQIQFSSDGTQISFRRADMSKVSEMVILANADGTNERVLATRTGTQFFYSAAVWSPDGKNLAIGGGDELLAPNGNIFPMLISIADGTVTELGSRKWEGLEHLVWHPKGDSLIVIAAENSFIDGQIWELSYPGGEYRRITNNLNGHTGLSITSDGNSIVTGELFSRSAVWVSPDLKPENAKQIMPSTGDTWGFSWTPDGRIVYSSNQTGDAEIWIMNADGSEGRPLTSDRIFKSVPAVSPDGRYVVYMSSQNGGQIIRIDIGGGNPVVLTKYNNSDNPHFSPDGKWVIYSALVEGVSRILRVPIDGGESQILSDQLATEPRYSNDGTRFACILFNEKSLLFDRIGIFPSEGGQPIKELKLPPGTSINRGLVWTPDDSEIILVVTSGEKQNLWRLPVDGGDAVQMTDVEIPGIARREYSSDGHRIALVRAEGISNAIMITGFR